jgi:tight adherence protein C
VHQLARGRRLADALAALPGVLGPGAQPVAEAIGAADRYGLPLGPVLERLADDARATRRRLAEAHARTLPVRLSFPLVTCTLPSFVLLAIVPAVLGTLSSLRGTGP